MDGVYYVVRPEIVPATFEVTTVDKLNDALTKATDGDTINLAMGTYDLGNTQLSINKSLTIQGADGVILDWSTGVSGSVGIYVENAANVVFDNITFKHAAYHSLAGRPQWSGSLTVRNCTFDEGYGIFLGAGTGKLIVDRCVFDGRDIAIGGLDAGKTDWDRVTITNSSFIGCTEAIGFKTIGINGEDIFADMQANHNVVGLNQIKGYTV